MMFVMCGPHFGSIVRSGLLLGIDSSYDDSRKTDWLGFGSGSSSCPLKMPRKLLTHFLCKRLVYVILCSKRPVVCSQGGVRVLRSAISAKFSYLITHCRRSGRASFEGICHRILYLPLDRKGKTLNARELVCGANLGTRLMCRPE